MQRQNSDNLSRQYQGFPIFSSWEDQHLSIPSLSIQQNSHKNISPSKISQALSLNITNPGWAGIAIDKKSEYPIKLNPIQNTEEKIGSISLPNGNILSDIASIEVGKNSQRRWDALIDGWEWVIIRVSKVPNANTVELTNTLLAKVAEIQKTLPKEIELKDDIFRQTWFIEKWLTNVEEALRDAAIIVAIIVVLFLMNARTAFITMISLPITLLLSAIVFYIFGIGINIMVLWGLTIAIGELVDDAIVDMENIFRRLRLNALLPTRRTYSSAQSHIRSLKRSTRKCSICDYSSAWSYLFHFFSCLVSMENPRTNWYCLYHFDDYVTFGCCDICSCDL
jgi:Cu/Ag efflux pump CusA